MLLMQTYVVYVNGILLRLTTRKVVTFVIPCEIKIHCAWVFITTCLGGDGLPWHTLACLSSGVIFFTMKRGISVSNKHLVLACLMFLEARISVEPDLPPSLLRYQYCRYHCQKRQIPDPYSGNTNPEIQVQGHQQHIF